MRSLLFAAVVGSFFACSGNVEPLDGGAGGGGIAAGGGTSGGGTGGGGTSGGGTGGGTMGGGAATGGGAASGGGAATGGGSAMAGCAGRTVKLCEDFDSATVGQLPMGWTLKPGWGQGTIAVSTDSAHSGSSALKSVSPNTGQPRAQRSLSMLGATQGTHWGRVFYKVPTPAPNAMSTMQYFHITFVGLTTNNSESRVVDTVQAPNGTIQYLYNLPDDSCCNGSAYNWRYDGNWHCAEWYVNNGTDSYRFFIDGMELNSLMFSGNSNARLADFTNVALGTIYYVNSNGTLTAYLDDLAIDDNRVGCQ
ncbi:MAG: hypothetical protein JNM17_30870 [Archangium sp.]|nr:hypothetical protein [Archangium sp.]